VASPDDRFTKDTRGARNIRKAISVVSSKGRIEMKREVLEQRLVEAQERITATEARIAYQMELISKLEAKGGDVAVAKRLLEQLLFTQYLRKRYRDRLREALKTSREDE
jgi:hypothetical protein